MGGCAPRFIDYHKFSVFRSLHLNNGTQNSEHLKLFRETNALARAVVLKWRPVDLSESAKALLETTKLSVISQS